MTLLNRLLPASLFLIMPFSIAAQTANNLQAKFGAPSKTYLINQNVTLTAEFGEDGQACQMLITERYNSGIGSEVRESDTAGDVLRDAAPEIQRGKRIQSTGSVGDCFNIRTDEYEKAIITDHSQLCGSAPNVKRTIQILWKQRRCQNGELIIDTRSPSTRLSPVLPPFAASSIPGAAKEIPQQPPCPNTEESNYVDYKRIYRRYEISQNSVILSLPQPDLTPEAINGKTTGKMIIEAVLHPCGAVTNLVFRGYVRNGLAEKASLAARQIKFKPAMNKGRPVPQRIQIEYNFYLCDKTSICTSVKEVME